MPQINDLLSREFIWKQRRAGKITSSTLPNLMKGGTGGKAWGDTAIDELYAVKYERRKNTIRAKVNSRTFEWGHQQEPRAIEWLRNQVMFAVKDCSNDFEQIMFCETITGFGDSPDAYIYDINGNVDTVVEVKCPVSQSKIEKMRDLKEISEDHEYYWQFIGHFIGTTSADKLIYLVYDGYEDEGHMVMMYRKDHEANIERCKRRILDGNAAINASLQGKMKLSDINQFYKAA